MMVRIAQAGCLVSILYGLTLVSESGLARAQVVDKSQISQKLDAGSFPERAEILRQIQRMPVESRGPTVLQALLEELDRQNQRLRIKEAVPQQVVDESVHGGDGELLLTVLETVCQHSNDPRIIPHLLPFLGNGGCVIDVLADFGEQSLPGVVNVANSNTSSDIGVYAALLSLQRMLEKASSRPLSDSSKRTIIEAAASRLRGRQPYIVALGAVDLAATSRDPSLIDRIRRASTSPEIAAELGIPSDKAAVFQEKAKTALSKVSR